MVNTRIRLEFRVGVKVRCGYRLIVMARVMVKASVCKISF